MVRAAEKNRREDSMKRRGGHEVERLGASGGFTLLEMLIAVVILGILAMVIVPQFSASSNDAKVSAMKADLEAMRSAVETYYLQHNPAYPGTVTEDGSGTAISDPGVCASTFADQLTRYTQANGQANVDATKLTQPLFGPYMKGSALPPNPFNNLNTVICDTTTTDVTARSVDNNYGWKFYSQTGSFIADDNGTSGGVAHMNY